MADKSNKREPNETELDRDLEVQRQAAERVKGGLRSGGIGPVPINED